MGKHPPVSPELAHPFPMLGQDDVQAHFARGFVGAGPPSAHSLRAIPKQRATRAAADATSGGASQGDDRNMMPKRIDLYLLNSGFLRIYFLGRYTMKYYVV